MIGGHVYRRSTIPGLRGAYFFGDFVSGHVWSTRWTPGDAVPASKTEHPELEMGANTLIGMGQDNAGEEFLLAIDGGIFLIEAL